MARQTPGTSIHLDERQDAAARNGSEFAMRMICLSALTLCATSPEAAAQVIEISVDGDAIIHDAPAVSEADILKPPSSTDDAAGSDAFTAAARRHGIDAKLLRAVAWAESRGRSDAVSNKGAIGIMQLMPATAASLGVDPRDPLANIDGGAAYLAQQLSTFGTVPLALAAYNAGPGAVIRYRGVPPYAETRAYVSNILRRLVIAPAAGTRFGGRSTGAAIGVVPRIPPVLLIEVPSQ